MVDVGQKAPGFNAIDCRGREVSLEKLQGKKVVLFFFPRAFTPACTIEIRHFRDHQALIESKGATLIGVSLDSVERQCQFAQAENIDFALIGDESRSISEKYGVVWPLLKRDRRATFVIDEQGVVSQVIHHEMQVHRHLDDVLERLGAQK
ncbi:MAG: peroxiredoxin [Myxococcaceae bacterium]|nr:peroxiredoxin [Myxococcaceae bacterium]